MQTYRGTINIAAAASYNDEAVEPPQRDSFGWRITSLSWGVAGNDTDNDHILLGASIKATDRTDLDLGHDGFAVDLLTLCRGEVVQTGANTVDVIGEALSDQESFVVANPVFTSKVNLFAKTPNNVAAGKSINIAYSLTIEQVRLTNDILSEINSRQFT